MLQQSTKEEAARQHEKKRIALELHDNVMNKLASTRLTLYALTSQKEKTNFTQALSQIESIQTIENEIRNIAHGLNQYSFIESDSYQSLLQQLVAEKSSSYKYTIHLEIDPALDWNRVPNEVKMNCYRILQEALHNISKYAQANQVKICFINDEAKLILTISDNGIGLIPNTNKAGMGIKNMKQRVKSLHGVFTLQSTPQKGTTIYCAIPI
jgi:signal transduction histidine kinase